MAIYAEAISDYFRGVAARGLGLIMALETKLSAPQNGTLLTSLMAGTAFSILKRAVLTISHQEGEVRPVRIVTGDAFTRWYLSVLGQEAVLLSIVTVGTELGLWLVELAGVRIMTQSTVLSQNHAVGMFGAKSFLNF